MIKNKVMVTGLAVGKDTGHCGVCNYDFHWLFENPSTLLWADKIVITPFIEGIIEENEYPIGDPAIAQSLNAIFTRAKDYDLIEVKDPSKLINDNWAEKMFEEVKFDQGILPKLFPDNIESINVEDIFEIKINNEEYCLPYLASIYTSLFLSKEWKANCMFSPKVLNYVNYKFGSSIINKDLTANSSPFNTIFNSIYPELDIFPHYLQVNEQSCKECKNVPSCLEKAKDTKLTVETVENNLEKLLELRDYDEIQQIKNVTNKIISEFKSKGDSFTSEDVMKEFKSHENEFKRKINKTHPKIKRWTNVVTIGSISITTVSIITGLPILTATGASIMGISKGIEKYIEYVEQKNTWISFINQ